MIEISNNTRGDKTFFSFIIICSILTSLVWVGDIFSWAWIGNGFLLDIILAVVAIVLTIITIVFYRSYKRKVKLDKKLDSLISDEEQQITCFNCGEMFNKRDGLCSSCGSPRPVCIVCFSEFRKKEKIVKLPCCSNYAHDEHIKNYLEIKGNCPKCHQTIKIEDLERISI